LRFAKKDLNYSPKEGISYLFENMPADTQNLPEIRSGELFEQVIDNLSIGLLAYGLPVDSALAKYKDNIQNSYTWKYCLNNFRDNFSEKELEFLA